MATTQRRSLEGPSAPTPAEAVDRLDAYEAADTPGQVLTLVPEHLGDHHLPEYARAVDGADWPHGGEGIGGVAGAAAVAVGGRVRAARSRPVSRWTV